MDELRLVRREEQSLIVATENGDEFRLVVDDTVFGEVRSMSRRSTSDAPVRPREIQALIRQGKSQEEVAELTGVGEDDIERYAEPVLAERRYILERAHAVPVRTGTGEDGSEQFGAVIDERLLTLGAEYVEWSSWRELEAGWTIALTFVSHGVDYRAVWSFDHRKGVLAPVTPDAVNLSKQGEVGDRLIPKLRAVDNPSGAPTLEGAFEATDGENHDAGDTAELSSARVSIADHPAARAEPEAPAPEAEIAAEFARRREIEHRAFNTPEDAETDLAQTADLLDALRRRRGEREGNLQPVVAEPGLVTPEVGASSDTNVSRELPPPVDSAEAMTTPHDRAPADTQVTSEADRPRSKRRASIPSWDDILFGTRSDEDPVS